MSAAVRLMLRWSAAGAGWLSGLCLATIFVVGLTNVVGRYTGGFSLAWSADLQRLLFIWAVFLGAASALHSRSHLAIEFLRERLPLAPRRVAVLAGDVLLLALLGVLLKYGWELTLVRRNIPYVQLGIAHAYATAALPVSAALMALFAIQGFIDDLRGRRSEEDRVEPPESLL